MDNEKIILGIDPGTTIMGYGIIKIIGKEANLVALGVIELKKYTDHYTKLKKIFDRVLSLIEQYHPDEMAVEAPFFGKNVQSMLKLGRAQGVAISAALSRSIPIFEYAPRKIKMSITGQGNASKEQVAMLLKNLLKINELPKDLDATDGLAASMCHFYQSNVPVSAKSFNSWKDFINKNPGRIK
ncbi:MAG: crossover junction endodeoxyribonuclease RuvC [Marinilabiliales bacterium]|nr:MAG: crossover junction endodeoxyribonuclease RuvC [Marinilabiliales bacterium]